MSKPYNDLIRNKLDDPLISDLRIIESDGGVKHVQINFSGSETKLKNFLDHDFIVLDTVPNDDGTILARLELDFN